MRIWSPLLIISIYNYCYQLFSFLLQMSSIVIKIRASVWVAARRLRYHVTTLIIIIVILKRTADNTTKEKTKTTRMAKMTSTTSQWIVVIKLRRQRRRRAPVTVTSICPLTGRTCRYASTTWEVSQLKLIKFDSILNNVCQTWQLSTHKVWQ